MVGETNAVLIDELPAKAHVWLNRNQLSDLINQTWNGTASLKINNADNNLRLLNLNFINSETFFNFSCYETRQWNKTVDYLGSLEARLMVMCELR